VSTLPDGVPGGDNTCADIHITPDGAHLYVSNRGHDSLAAFAVSGNGSTLTSRGHTETEARPREFEISPRGRYLFAAGRDSNMMASYTRQNDGQLVPGPVYDVGTEPLWVLAVEIPAA
jgi:6-phosphogluconolactonase